jgi:hypothetical protein
MKPDVRGQMTEDRWQKTENGRQLSDDRRPVFVTLMLDYGVASRCQRIIDCGLWKRVHGIGLGVVGPRWFYKNQN